MILLAHLLFGAAIGSSIKNIFLALILAFLGHYFLDLFPHIEYNIENIKEKQWHKALPAFLRVLADFCIGVLLIFIFSNNQPIVYFCAFLSILPDVLSFLYIIWPSKILTVNYKLHTKIHFLKDKKISYFWRIFSQVLAIIISIIILFFFN
jgi:hypothetical protein